MFKKEDPTPEETQERIKKLEEKLESVEQDVYSPEAQAAFEDYKGTAEQFEEEKRLRRIASGKAGIETRKSKLFKNITAVLTGDRDLTREISKRFEERYSAEAIEGAKKVLEEEFGVKKKESQEELVTRKFREVFKEEISPFEQSISGITKGVDLLKEDIERTNRAVQSISKNLIGTINNALMALAGGGGTLDRTSDKMKPVSVADEEGKEYLYYPDAPPGRQLYEKSKTGTAGRIASKEVQRELESEIKRINRESDLNPVRAGTGDLVLDSLVGQIKVLLEEESMFRKRDMEKLVEDLKEHISNKKESIFDLESDEQKQMLADALERALETVISRNPELLQAKMMSSNFDLDFDRRRGPGGPTPYPTPDGRDKPGRDKPKPGGKKSIPQKLLDLYTEFKMLDYLKRFPKGRPVLLGAGMLGILAGVAGAISASAGIFGSLEFGMKEVGDKAIEDISKGSAQDIATAIVVPKYGAYTLQELERMAVDDPVLKSKLEEAKKIAGIAPKTKPANLTLSQKSDNVGQQIVDQNQKRLEIQNAERVDIPAQSVTNVNNTQVIPIPSNKKTIEIHNNENTFNRLLAQDFDHPSTYTSMNMG
jgi:hypothetical protein